MGHCAYMVSSQFRGRRLGRRLCQHSLSAAKERGFVAIQFNMVVSTNVAAVKSWQKCGFAIVGTLPRAYDHKDHGLVDAYVMYRLLDDIQVPKKASTPEQQGSACGDASPAGLDEPE